MRRPGPGRHGQAVAAFGDVGTGYAGAGAVRFGATDGQPYDDFVPAPRTEPNPVRGITT
ncbi:hypothetical protein [Streptomyces sp. NPDC058457]|uniref:hypothetical protein n=1 Tax=Streptomyces sp. NPDC058457 TaxID=3346507 RepID=UPI00364EAF2D